MSEPIDLKRHRRWLFLAALIVRLCVASLIHEPGYMDTAYYTVQGVRLAEGDGATEPYLWHYLDNPTGLPHPAFGYWMPISALLVAPFWRVSRSFFAAQLPFAALSAAVAVLGAHIAWEVTRRRRSFWAAGALLTFSAYFFPFWTLPETFAPYALCGSLCLRAAGRYWGNGDRRWAALAAGAAVLAYLTRSDGLLLVAMALVLPVLRRDVKGTFAVSAVTIALFSPWIAYNLSVRGTPLPTGGTQTLWLTNYDDIFCYDCVLSWRTYLDWGWPAIIESKMDALIWNVQTLFAVVGFIFLGPFAIIGGWRLRKSPAFVLAWGYLLLLFAAMTFAFSFPGPRGGLFHSAGALLPFITVAGLVGIDRVVAWAGHKRGWNIPQAQIVFTWGFVALSAVMSVMALTPKLAAWREANVLYRNVGVWLKTDDEQVSPVLVGNPPGFWYTTRIPALMAPNEDANIAAHVAERYGACWLLLNENHPQPLADLYSTDASPRWELAVQWESEKLYKLVR